MKAQLPPQGGKEEEQTQLTEAKPAVPLIFLNVLIIVWAIAFG